MLFTCEHSALKQVVKAIENGNKCGSVAGSSGSILFFAKEYDLTHISNREKPVTCTQRYKKEFEFPKWMGQYPRMGSPWNVHEEQELLKGYRDDKLTIEELCKKHGRQEGGILSRLENWYPEIREKREAQREIEKLENELKNLRNRADDIGRKIAEMKK